MIEDIAMMGEKDRFGTNGGPKYYRNFEVLDLLQDPGVTGVAAVKMLANVKWRISFRGKTAHAAMEPWNAVNALDAVCLSYNAVSMLRQQIRPHERIHGVFDEAGDRPNVIPGKSSVVYYGTSPPQGCIHLPTCVHVHATNSNQSAATLSPGQNASGTA